MRKLIFIIIAALVVGTPSPWNAVAQTRQKKPQSVMPQRKGRAGLKQHSSSVLDDTTSFSEYKRDVKERYERDRAAMIERFLAYRDSITKAFAEALAQEWEKEQSQKPVDPPKDNSVPPQIDEPAPEPEENVKEEPTTKPKNEGDAIAENTKPRKQREIVQPTKVGKIKVAELITIPSIKHKKQPEPVVPVELPKETIAQTLDVNLYGTIVKIKIDDDCRFKLVGNDNLDVSRAVGEIGKNDKISEVLKDCLKARDELHLCDWAYYQLLTRLGTTFFGKECSEATLLTGYLYCMSGYKMRFAFLGTTLEILVACEQRVMGQTGVGYDNTYYVIFGKKYPDNTSVALCDFSLPKEKEMSLWIKEEPLFAENHSLVKHRPYRAVQPMGYRVNKVLIDFYDSYPKPYTEGDPYSTWTYYAQTPMSAEAQRTLYPQLRQQLEGKSLYEQLKTIMFFIEGYKYGYDNEIWGGERPFFAEETIFYPMSDCEDHAILFTRLVRDLLHLPTAVVYYPDHLAAAVKVPEQIPGDYLTSSRGDYLVCDPTYYYTGPGVTMPQMVGKPAKLIIIED